MSNFAQLFSGVAQQTPDTAGGDVDLRRRAYGYESLLVCHGSVVPANPGVNPSLTITALAEHAMSYVPARDAPASPGGC